MESTLSLQITDLTGEVGFFLGYGRGAVNGEAAYSTLQQNAIDSIVKSGLRQFYFPPPIEGMESSYDWSFLKPRATVGFPPKAQTIPLPDDFRGFEGQLVLTATTSQMALPLDLQHEGRGAMPFHETPPAQALPRIASSQCIHGPTV